MAVTRHASGFERRAAAFGLQAVPSNSALSGIAKLSPLNQSGVIRRRRAPMKYTFGLVNRARTLASPELFLCARRGPFRRREVPAVTEEDDVCGLFHANGR